MRPRCWLILLVLAVTACDSNVDVPRQPDPGRVTAGTLRSVTRIGHHAALKNRAVFWWMGLSDAVPVSQGVTLYRVEYWTTASAGEHTHASGLVAVPGRTPFRGVVSYQHPTRTARTNVPSTPSDTALLAAIAFAGHGYLFVAPDYLGLGTSPGFHPYLHASTEANSVVDLLRATRILLRRMGLEWPEALFLTGFSQGGHASLAAQRGLEQNPVEGLRVAASAPIAGTYNISSIQFPYALEGHSQSHSAYLAYVTTSYARVYHERLTSVIVDAHARSLPALLDGSRSLPELAAALPHDPAEMFQPDFVRGYRRGDQTWFTRALALNDVFDWTPQAPVRFYYGTGDLDSPARDTLFTVEHMRRRGGEVSSVNVGDKDHNQVGFSAIPQVRAWFDEILQRSDARRRRR